jgi:phenylacetate-coenzyme A ligase PaaK-like adenylate-forming protein
MDLAGLKEAVFSADAQNFDFLAMEVFKFQSENCEVYSRYLGHLQTDITKIINIREIPHLPITFFKNFEVRSGSFVPEAVFESSSTTGAGISRHFVKDTGIYAEAFTRSFDAFFGDHRNYCHLALLPSYLERQHSSLVYQVNHFIQQSAFGESSFFLHDLDALHNSLMDNERKGIPTILWGVTYALLDYAEKYRMQLRHTHIIETGGMKGRRKEITREELHDTLCHSFTVPEIAGEYGMTELMSQAYAVREGIYKCPLWMRASAREINDPLGPPVYDRHGVINIIDLANLHSCAFIATSDIGKVFTDNSFTVLGRLDHSDTRGCNLLVD